MAEVKIQVLKDGPYLVTGSFSLVDENGKPIDTPKENVVALCRCGGSLNKPFCDGTHSAIGFRGAQKAVAEASRGEDI